MFDGVNIMMNISTYIGAHMSVLYIIWGTAGYVLGLVIKTVMAGTGARAALMEMVGNNMAVHIGAKPIIMRKHQKIIGYVVSVKVGSLQAL
jgi:hypothetical protein